MSSYITNTKCEQCKREANNRYDRIEYISDWGMYLCGGCEKELEAGLEAYEEDKRAKIAEDNEY